MPHVISHSHPVRPGDTVALVPFPDFSYKKTRTVRREIDLPTYPSKTASIRTYNYQSRDYFDDPAFYPVKPSLTSYIPRAPEIDYYRKLSPPISYPSKRTYFDFDEPLSLTKSRTRNSLALAMYPSSSRHLISSLDLAIPSSTTTYTSKSHKASWYDTSNEPSYGVHVPYGEDLIISPSPKSYAPHFTSDLDYSAKRLISSLDLDIPTRGSNYRRRLPLPDVELAMRPIPRAHHYRIHDMDVDYIPAFRSPPSHTLDLPRKWPALPYHNSPRAPTFDLVPFTTHLARPSSSAGRLERNGPLELPSNPGGWYPGKYSAKPTPVLPLHHAELGEEYYGRRYMKESRTRMVPLKDGYNRPCHLQSITTLDRVPVPRGRPVTPAEYLASPTPTRRGYSKQIFSPASDSDYSANKMYRLLYPKN